MYRLNRLLLIVIVCMLVFQCPMQLPLEAAASPVNIVNGTIAENPSTDQQNDFKQVEYLNNGTARLNDYANGFSITFPADMYVDASISKVMVVIANADTKIEIYHDVFSEQTITKNVSDYIGYSNRFLNNSTDHQKLSDEYTTINGHRAHILSWERAALAKVNGDKNKYLSAEIIKSNNEVYTILLKTSSDPKFFMPVINSFKTIDATATPRINTVFKKPLRLNLTEDTKAFYEDYFSDNAPLKWGIYEYSIANDWNYLNNLEESLRGRFDFVLWYKSMSTPFPRDIVESAYNNNKFVELTFHSEFNGQNNQSVMYDILNGKYDAYLNQYAQEIKAFGHPILFRLNNEMNGDWCNWSSFHFSKDTEIFKLVWRHIYEIFAANQVDNALWVWNPNDRSFPDFQWNHSLAYFPGSDYVDIIGMTGYNTGTYFPGEPWREFTAIYDNLYQDYHSWFGYPFMITEFACNSVGGDKARWILDMRDGFDKYPMIKVAVWFNGIDYDANRNPARIYRLDETSATTKAFAEVLSASGPLDMENIIVRADIGSRSSLEQTLQNTVRELLI